jgi:hypothetical protein
MPARELTIDLPWNFAPRSYQRELWGAYERGIRRFDECWHRRAGKDSNGAAFMLARAMERVGVYYHILPTFNQARKVLWDGINSMGMRYTDFFPESLLYSPPNNSDMKVTLIHPQSGLAGSVIQLVGADDLRAINRLVGTNPVGLIYSEWSLINPIVRDLFRPVIAENDGWEMFIYTPRGRNHAWEQHERAKKQPERWHCSHLSILKTVRDADAFTLRLPGIERAVPAESGLPVVTEQIVKDIIADGMEESTAQQEFFCSFTAANAGTYFGPQMEAAEREGRITDLPWDPNKLVHTWWDIGVNDTTAIWFVQRVGHWIHAIDYLEDTGQGIDYFAKRLKELPYNYGQHIGPHDLRVREWGANGATKRLDAARTLGLNFIVAPNIPRQDGIDAVRRSIPRFRFEKTKCQRGVYALQSYHKEWDDEKKCYRDSPHHDWASNGADAFRMGIVGWDADSDDRRRDEPTEMKFDPYRYEHERPIPQVIREFNAFTGE